MKKTQQVQKEWSQKDLDFKPYRQTIKNIPPGNENTQTNYKNMKNTQKLQKAWSQKYLSSKPYRQTIKNIPTNGPWAHGPHGPIYGTIYGIYIYGIYMVYMVYMVYIYGIYGIYVYIICLLFRYSWADQLVSLLDHASELLRCDRRAASKAKLLRWYRHPPAGCKA